MKKKVFSLMMTLLFGFFGLAQAQVSLPYSDGFEDGIGSWTMSNCHSSTGVSTGFQANSGSAVFCFYYSSNYPQYLISPELSGGENGVELSFFYACYISSYSETFKVGYSTTTNDVSAFTFGNEVTVTNLYSDGYLEYTETLPAGTKYVAVACTSDDRFYLFLDDFTFTAVAGGGGETQVVNVTIGDPTSTATHSYLPGNSLYDYSISQQIYTADEIGVDGTINTLTLWLKNSSSYARHINVYMKETSESTFASNTSWVSMTADDMVASFTMNNGISDPVEMAIDLSTPFDYSGNGNLVICFQDVTGQWNAGLGGVVMEANGDQSHYAYQDDVMFDPSVAPNSYNNSVTNSKNVVSLNITTTISGGDDEDPENPNYTMFAQVWDPDTEEYVQVRTINVGQRPNGYWMEPYKFQLRNDGAALDLTNIDFTPADYFTVVSPDLEESPVHMEHNGVLDVELSTGTTDVNGDLSWQMVALYTETRLARIWNITAEPYDPETPDVWELACEDATAFPFTEYPAHAHNTTLHDDYNLPYPEIEDGNDAVYKLVFDHDMIISANVDPDNYENGKVALYAEDFNGEGGPMADNNITEFVSGANGGGGGGVTGPVTIYEDGTETNSYVPVYGLYTDDYLKCEMVYPQADLAGLAGTTIHNMKFYSSTSNTNWGLANFQVFMTEVSSSTISSFNGPANATMVYQGPLSIVDGTMTVNFTTPYTYNGGNLLIGVYNTVEGSWVSCTWLGVSATGASVQGYSANGLNSVSPTQRNFLPKVTFNDGRNMGRDLTVDFENGMPEGWTVIDANGDGLTWCMTSDIPSTWTYYSGMTLDWYHNGTNAICSGSYINGPGAVNPDEYFVSPLVTLGAGSSIDFWVAATDASYPADHFGVFVSSDLDNWTSVQEWTLSSRSGGSVVDPRATRDGEGTRLGAWFNYNVDLSAYEGQQYVAFRHFNCYDEYIMCLDDITIVEGQNGGQGDVVVNPLPYTMGPEIIGFPVEPGTYYLVASDTKVDFEVNINAQLMPCPDVDNFVWVTTPADDEAGVEPSNVTLSWNIPAYATEWRIILGSTYWPELDHPYTQYYPQDEDGNWTWATTLANSWDVPNDLFNNTNYFWRVEFRNYGACTDGVQSPVFGFTTHLNRPFNLQADDETVFDDQDVTLSWEIDPDRTFRKYFIYRDGEKIGETTEHDMNATSFTVPAMEDNHDGYVFTVTAIYDEGESAQSDPVTVHVASYGSVSGTVFEQDGETGIAGATVTITGEDIWHDTHTYSATTGADGTYTIEHVEEGTYNGQASCPGYQPIDHPIQGNPFDIEHFEDTNPIDYMLDENFYGPCGVVAQYYPDSTDVNAEYVKVYWGCGLPTGAIVEDFEDFENSNFEWQNDATHPWTIVATNPYEGESCLKSGGAGVSNVNSNLSVTVNIPQDGVMSFYGKISCENNWDYGYFYIDGVQKGSYTGAGSWTERTFDITAGEHTFKWSYTKDNSVNSNDDCFYIDYITFYRPEESQARNDENRAFSHYRVYRTNCYNPGPYDSIPNDVEPFYPNPMSTSVLSCEVTDTVFIDTYWADPEITPPGVYKWGVGCVYVGNRGEEIESPITWSEPVHVMPAAAVRENRDITVDFETGELPEGWTTIENTNSWYVSNQGYYGNPASANGGTYAAFVNGSSSSGYDYLVSPALDFSGTGSVSFAYVTPSWVSDQNTLAVAYSTSATGPWTTVWGPQTANSWTTANVSLSLTGTYYIAFVSYNDYGYCTGVDDITITGAAGGGGGGGGASMDNPYPAGNEPIQEDRESVIVWSNCLDKDMYLDDNAVNITVLLNSADSPAGVKVNFTNLNEVEQELYPMDEVELDETGYYAWDHFRKGEYQLSITNDGYYDIDTLVSIWEPTALRYVMIEIIRGVENLYVSSTGWAMWDLQTGGQGGEGGDVEGDEFSFGFEEDPLANGWTIETLNPYETWERVETVTFASGDVVPHEGQYQMELFWEYDDQDEWLITPAFDVPSNASLTFWMYGQLGSTNDDHYYVKASTDNGTTWTALWDATAQPAAENHYSSAITVDLAAYAGQNIKLAWNAQATGGLWYAWFIDDITVAAGRNVISFDGREWHRQPVVEVVSNTQDNFSRAGDFNVSEGERHLEYYKVMCESLDHEPIFNANVPADRNFCQVDDTELVEGEIYLCKVAAVYSTGMSEWAECQWQYIPCENYAGTVNGIEVEGNTLSWEYPGGGEGPDNPDDPQGGDVTLVLNVPGDPWGDGTGYQMILDADHNQYGNQIPESGNFTAGNFDEYEYTIPEDAVCDTYTNTIVINGSATITIPAGIYDYAFLNPMPGGTYYIASNTGNFPGRGDDYEFLAGKTYTFTVAVDYNDQINLVITDTQGRALGFANNHVASHQSSSRVNANYVAPAMQLNAAGHGNGLVANTNNRDGWYYYDSGVNDDAIGLSYGTANFYWGIMFPAGTYEGTSLTKVGYFDYTAHTGNVLIYQGGSDAPGTLVYTQPYSVNGTEQYIDIDMDAAVTIDPAQNLWVVMQSTTPGYTASIDDSPTCTPNGSWISMDGSTWYESVSAASSGSIVGNWNLRAYIEDGAPVPPTPGEGDVIGAMIFVDGEWEAFVEYPTNSYTYEGDGNEVCVRIVHDGTNDLPEGNIYYSMSCPECEELNPSYCAPGDPIHAEVLDATDQVKIWWGVEPADPIEDWLYYDDGENEDAIGLQGGGSFYWAIKFPAASLAQYEGCAVTKIGYFDYTAHTGVVRIYQGSNGNGPSNNMVGSYNYTATGTEDWVEWDITPAAFDNTEDLWIVMNNTTGGYVAAVGAYTGDPNGTMLSTDGSTWYTLSDATQGQLEGTWNLRCYVTNQYAGAAAAVEMALPTLNNGRTLAHTGIAKGGNVELLRSAEIDHFNVYRSDDNVEYTVIAAVPYDAEATYYEYIDTPETAGTYYYKVTAYYENDCESDGAPAYDNPDNNYVQVEVTGMGENNDNVALYPNPTSGNVTIEAAGMSRITVVSVLGQVVFDTEVSVDTYTLNMAQFNTGMYMVRINTESGVVVKRVTVMQ